MRGTPALAAAAWPSNVLESSLLHRNRAAAAAAGDDDGAPCPTRGHAQRKI